MASGIYAIKCILTGDSYIGSAVNFNSRWKVHRRLLEAGAHHAQLLQEAWDYHGPEWFDFNILEICERERNALLRREQFYFDTLHPVYNVAPYAGTMLGFKHSAETIARMTGRKLSSEHRAKMYGRVFSSDTREKMRQRKLGGKQEPEHVEKRARHIRGVPKTKEHTVKTQEGKRVRKFRELTEQAEENRKLLFIKNDTREEARQFRDEQVRAIRQDERQIVVIAAEYGVSPAAIKKIKVRKTYQDVPDEGPISKDTSLNEQTTVITVFGIEYESVQAACAALNPPVKPSMIYYRLSHGMTPDQAFTEREPVKEWLSQFKYLCNYRYTALELFDDYQAFEKSSLDGSGIDHSKQKWSNEFGKLINTNSMIRKHRTSTALYYIFDREN